MSITLSLRVVAHGRKEAVERFVKHAKKNVPEVFRIGPGDLHQERAARVGEGYEIAFDFEWYRDDVHDHFKQVSIAWPDLQFLAVSVCEDEFQSSWCQRGKCQRYQLPIAKFEALLRKHGYPKGDGGAPDGNDENYGEWLDASREAMAVVEAKARTRLGKSRRQPAENVETEETPSEAGWLSPAQKAWVTRRAKAAGKKVKKEDTSTEPRGYRALSVRQPYAEEIAKGKKKIEYRTWYTDYRGPLLIVASHRPDPGAGTLPRGSAVCLVDLVEVLGEPGDYRWRLKNPRRVESVPVAGRLKLFRVDTKVVKLAQR